MQLEVRVGFEGGRRNWLIADLELGNSNAVV